jgi:hypothetical protein
LVAVEGNQVAVVRLLAAAGADVGVQDKRGNTAMDVVVERTMEEGKELLRRFYPGFVSPKGNKVGGEGKRGVW